MSFVPDLRRASMVKKHSIESRVLHFVRQHRMIQQNDPLLMGVSGGPDSVALLHILMGLKDDLQIARMTVVHFDHGLRDAESLEDRRFVERLASGLGLDCECGAEDVRGVARDGRISLEMAARFCRHRFFQQVKTARGAQRIALAHTANDQAEEVLLRLCRGSGPSGLGGMRPREDSGIVRPLLFATKVEIIAYLNARRLPYRLDSSNQAPICQRNRIRLEVLPLLEETLHPGVVPCIQRHAQLVQDEEDFWTLMLESLWPTVCEVEGGDGIRLRCRELRELHPALLRRMLRHALQKLQHNLLGIYSNHIEILCDLVARHSGGKRIHLPGTLRAEIREEILLLGLRKTAEDEALVQIQPVWIRGPGEWSWGEAVLVVRLVDSGDALQHEGFVTAASNRVCMDARLVQWPLCLRGRQPGDRFRPLGLGGWKKLQDFFVDLKLPREARGSVPILCDREKICWVVGYRLDDRVKIAPATRSVLVVELVDNGSLE